jgi:hypothetical protein
MYIASSSASVLDYIQTFIWPVVVSGFLAYFLYRYEDQIGRLIERIRSVRALGTEIALDVGPQVVGSEAAAEESLADAEIIDVLIDDYEQRLQERHLQAEEERKELLRHIALTDLQLSYERTYRVIYGSQIAALRALRAAPNGVTRSGLNVLLEQSKATWSFATWLQALPLDTWLGFLFYEELITYPNGVGQDPVKITPKGEGFLDYIDLLRLAPRIF